MRPLTNNSTANSPKMPRMHCVSCSAVFLGLFVIAIVGCAKFDLRRNIPWQETPDKPVRSVVAFWTEAVIERTSGPPYRGFGGRLLFYPADMSQPVKVQGTVVVYAFDEDLPPPENLKPVRKFVFTNEQLQEVYSESKLGPSYNLLIPWEEFSSKSRRVSLIVRYIPENGPSVVSEQVKVFLPGLDESMLAADPKPGNNPNPLSGLKTVPTLPTNSPPNMGTATLDSPVRPTNYQQVIEQPANLTTGRSDPSPSKSRDDSKENKRRMETLTLNISPRLGRAIPSQASNSLNATDQLNAEKSTQPTQDSQNSQTSTEQNPATGESSGMSAPMSLQSYGQPITPSFQANPPPSPGDLIKDLSRQPPTRFEPYRPLVPKGGVSQAPIGHPQSVPSP